ncbi:MAG TPA: tetratricopeptide repeat protein [archaeon]|nr:tetratricopeptide repeat protein [archaeon]
MNLKYIGQIYLVQGNYPEALKMYERALKIDEQLGHLSEKAGCLNNIASIHYS